MEHNWADVTAGHWVQMMADWRAVWKVQLKAAPKGSWWAVQWDLQKAGMMEGPRAAS